MSNEITRGVLCHKWSKSKKHEYNVNYYKTHKYLWSDKRYMGDNSTLTREAGQRLTDAENRAKRADELRVQSFKDALKNKRMGERADAAGIPAAARALRSTAYDKYAEARDYLDQKNYIKKKQIHPLEGDVAYRRTMSSDRGVINGKGYGEASSKPAPSARVQQYEDRPFKYADKKFEKAVSAAENAKHKLDWKLKPIKSKASRKAKEFVSNWKSGASSISSAAKSASSKVGKSFLDKKIATRVTNFRSPGGTTTTTSSITIRDAIKGSKGSKRNLSGQPQGFVENWKQGASDIAGVFKRKKRK